MPKDIPPDLRVIFDAQNNVVHFPVESSQWAEPLRLDGIGEFAAYLNTKAGTPRFTVITAAFLVVKDVADWAAATPRSLKAIQRCASA